MTRESKKIVYKKAGGLPDGETLQDALARALRKYNQPAKRLDELGADRSQVRFINVHRRHLKATIGIFHKVTKGAGQYVIEMAAPGDEWKVQLISAGVSASVEREFVEGTLYFAVWKNHVVMHQSNACRADQFQSHCSWILSKAATSPGGDATARAYLVELSDPLSPDMRRKSKQPVKSVKFGGAVQMAAVGTGSKTQRARMHFTPKGGMWEGLKAILKVLKADLPEEMFFDDAIGEQDIRVDLELSCTKKKAQSTAGEVLGAFGRALSHSEADAVVVELADGTKIRAKDMKVEKDVRVECVQKQPVAEEIFKAMVEWLQELIDIGTVVEEEAFGNTK